MNIENHNTQFNYEAWLNKLHHFIDTTSQFLNELFEGLKILAKKRLSEMWKDIRFSVSKLTAQDFFIAASIILTGILGIIIFFSGLGLLIYQTVLWLQDGTWTQLPLYLFFSIFFENTAFHEWVLHPESWFGLQKLFFWFLNSIPLSVALMIPGISIAFLMAGTMMVTLTYRFYKLSDRND
jgi:hypothetical protein